ncbi:hypothetical protein [Pontibacter beigongshangensis]|uniref:hypothetical protein n=1 Tax=Pontibacter beigongshangensis TaxID=2574733 RepID=UPI0016505DD6|nr:hypothetical protein [Pontibacter beigongshangensis]
MKLYKNYTVLILLLAIVLNWVVEGNNFMGKVDMNLGLLPKFSIVVIEFLQVAILIRILVLYSKVRFIVSTLAAVTAFCILQLVINKAMGAEVSVWISGIRYYFSFLPLFLLSYLLAYKNWPIKREFNWLLVLIVLQIPVTIYQYLNAPKVTILIDRQLLFDMISGTMGGTASNLMSLLIGFGLLYALIKLVEKKEIKYLLLSLLLLVPSILAEAKGMLIVILIALGYLAFIFKFNITNILALGVLAAAMVIGFSYIYIILGYGNTLTASFLIDYASSESGSGRLSRIDSVVHSFNLLLQNDTLLLGMGIGNANKSPLGHDGQFFDFYTIRHSVDILIAETGLLGITFLTAVLVKLIWISMHLLKTETINQNKDHLLIVRIFLGSIFIFIYGLFWVDVLFRVQFMYPFGMLAGYIIGLYHKDRFDRKAAAADNNQAQAKRNRPAIAPLEQVH